MKRLLLLSVLWVGVLGGAQTAAPAGGGELETVLEQMDNAAAGFKTAQADFQFDQYQKVVNETDTQKGKVFFRRNRNGVDVAVKITSPDAKYVLFKDGKLQMYEPRIDQITERDESKNKSDVEAIMSIGFGGRGHDLPKQFEVKMEGWETVDGVKTARLELVPKSDKFRNVYSRILLWIDPARDVSLKQQFLEPSGDYRLAHYSAIKLNRRISDDVFKIKGTSSTKTVRP